MPHRFPVPPHRRIAAYVALVCLLATGLAMVPPGPTGADPAGPGTTGADDVTVLTLVTGDRLLVRDETKGHRSVTFQPGPGRDHITVHQLEIDGELHVYPSDALPKVSAGRVDEDLFNVNLLLEDGYGDGAMDEIPLIAHTTGAPRALAAPDGADLGASLSSIEARSLQVDKADAGDFWKDVTAGRRRLGAGVAKLWLDHRVEAHLERSVPRIGAPAAWQAGYDGQGVTVAVLDTGVDDEHPDLAGQVRTERNFSDSDNTEDHVGHGTHVASTIAGTGTASTPARRGVAPGAEVISGKVLDDSGKGWESDVIAGMEWAVEENADVVNLSLGGDPTDGRDPLSSAVNRLSADSDSLFVISAGNAGPSVSSIGSPGAADAALTVGAVDRDESLAPFSSRGPRMGDRSVKPDLTAPGVGIAAARASGTSMGSPVDEFYTRASGTSMAAPHVAGAAALLVQQEPGRDGEALKDLLVSTALPGDLTEYEQGGGRVDVERAVTQQVYATGTVHLGTFEVDQRKQATRTVTFTNESDRAASLDLELDVADRAGNPPPQGALELSANTVRVPAGGTGTVEVSVDPNALGQGSFTGQLLARDGDLVVHTTLAAVVEPPTHEVTIEPVGLDGEFAAATPVVLVGSDPRFDTVVDVWKHPVTVELGEGSYFLSANMSFDYRDESAVASIVDPDLEVTEDMTLDVDLREANRVEIKTPRPAVHRHDLGYSVRRVRDGRSFVHSVQKFATTRSMWVTPTDRAEGGEFEWTSRWQLQEPLLRARTVGGGAPLRLTPHYERYSPAIDGRRRLEVVDAGAGTAEDYAGLDVEGKIALVQPPYKGALDLDAGVEAGAEMLLIRPPEGDNWPTKYTHHGERLALPVAVLTPTEGDRVTARLGRGRLRLRLRGAPHSRYLYDVVQVSQDRVPRRVLHRVSRHNSTTVRADYHEMGGEPLAKEQRYAWRPWQETTIVEKQRELPTPQSRREVISSGAPGTLWRQHVLSLFSWDSMNPITSGAVHPIRTYRPGSTVSYDWFAAPVRPGVPADRAATRTGDELDLHIAEFAGPGGETYDVASQKEVSMLLHENGRLVASGERAWGTFPVERRRGGYVLDLQVRREDTETWDFSTRTDTTWRFHSRRPKKGSAELPLLQVDYQAPVGLDNRVAPGRRRVGFRITHPRRGVAVRDVRAWISFDDGVSWKRLRLRPGRRDQWRTRVRHPRSDEPGYASLRVRARDDAGNRVDQTVIRAYGIRGD